MGLAQRCWIDYSLKPSTQGYSQISRRVDGQKKLWLGHRLAYETLIGPIPTELVIDHLCRNRRCYNPYHLETVTNSENVKRGDPGKYLKDRTHCPYGHEYTPENIKPSKDGSRRCRECHRRNNRETMRKRYAIERMGKKSHTKW